MARPMQRGESAAGPSCTQSSAPLPAWIPKSTYFNLLSKSIIADQLLDSEALLGAAYDKLQEEKDRSGRLERRLVEVEDKAKTKFAALERAVVVLLERLRTTIEQTAMVPIADMPPMPPMSRRRKPTAAAKELGEGLSFSSMEEVIANAEIVGKVAQQTCTSLKDRLVHSQEVGREAVEEMARLRAETAAQKKQLAALQARVESDEVSITRLREEVSREQAKVAESVQRAEQARIDAKAAVARRAHEVEAAEARALELEGSLIDTNDQLIATEEEAFALRHFVTQQAQEYKEYLHAELTRRFGFVPTSVDNFMFELIPPPALGPDMLPAAYAVPKTEDKLHRVKLHHST